MANVIVYNQDLKPVAVLENAFDIGYEQRINEVWSAHFSLPVNDPKNEECQLFRYVEIFDGGERVELFRIIPFDLEKDADSAVITYTCEHVLATLIDDLMFQYHQTTNLSPADTLSYILSFQSTPYWQVGTVDFTDSLSYKWENEQLLSALFSIPKAYTDEYMWTWDTTVTPWQLNLVRPDSEATAVIRYRKNLIGIKKSCDPTYIVTRIYPLGYGEGVNQLTIKDVNGGVPYVDADTVGTYGVKALKFIDKTEENPAMLLSKAQAYLEKNKIPRITYSVNAADIYQITNDSIDKLVVGSLVRVYDEETNLQFISRIAVKTKPDIVGDPGNVDIQIGNKVLEIMDTTSNLQRAQLITDVYSQGAVNIDSNDYQDNCDDEHPAVIEFYIPEECVNINKCLLTFKTDKFRAYEKSIAAAPTTTSSSSSSSTTVSGGGATDLETTGNAFWDIGGSYGISDVTEYVNEHSHGVVSHYHKFDLPSHSHGMQHTHTIPSHTHGISYGIYEYSTLATSLTVKVDGTTVPGISGTSLADFDIIPYLSKDGDNKINRGSWHKVEITPNNLARITASVVKQIFVQSKGGSTY